MKTTLGFVKPFRKVICNYICVCFSFYMISTSTWGNSSIYEGLILEDFEKNKYTDKQIITKENRSNIHIKIRNDNPAPNARSEHYLSIESLEQINYAILIRPPEKILIKDYLHKITLWVYGQNDKSSIYIILKNNFSYTYRFKVATLNFKGWKKLSLPISAKINQMNSSLYKNSYLQLWGISFVPAQGNLKRSGIYFYLDDIKALIRKKYLLRAEKE